MPNVLDIEPMRAFAQRAAKKIPNESVRARFERLAFDQLRHDARNFRPALRTEINTAPAWAYDAFTRGERLVTFKLCHSACLRLHNVARRISTICELSGADREKQPHLAHAITEAKRLIAKIDHASFEVIAEKAHRLARAYTQLSADADFQPHCEVRTVRASSARAWHRITSIAELRSVGREFHNCLARAPYAHHHANGLRVGLSQYWVLRDSDGGGLVVAMADAPQATHLIEVRGPNNAVARGYELDLQLLSAAIGMHDPDPPPLPPGLMALVRAMPGPCRCADCRPAMPAAPLLRSARAP